MNVKKLGKLGRLGSLGILGVLLIIFNFQFFSQRLIGLWPTIFNFSALAQGSPHLGTFTPPPTQMPEVEPTEGTARIPTPQPGSIAPPEIDCVTDYRPRGNNERSRSRVYGMLLKKHKSGTLARRFALADEDVISMAGINYRLFGRLPDTDNRAAIAEMIKKQGTIGSTADINYFYMKGYLRFEGILGETLSEVENNLAGLDCEARIEQVRRRSSSPIRVFADPSTSSGQGVRVRIRVLNRVVREIGDIWEFRAQPNGDLLFADGSQVREIKFDYELFGNYRPQEGILVKGKLGESGELVRLIKRLNLGFLEKEIVELILNKVPEANYYFVSVFPKRQADKALRWEVNPKPDREYKYIFYVRPYVENKNQELRIRNQGVSDSVIKGLRFEKRGLTVFDYNVFVDY